MLKNHTILCDSNIPWHHNRYSKHHLMSRFARDNRVYFVNPSIEMADYFKGIFLKSHGRIKRRVWNDTEHLTVYTSLSLPMRKIISPMITLDHLFFSRQMRAIVRHVDRTRFVLFLGNACNVFLLDSIGDYACSLYHCSDNFPALFSGSFAECFKKQEETMIRRSDLVIATSELLYEKCIQLNKNSHFIPHGVDERFFCTNVDKAERLDDLEENGFPLIGYIGSIDALLDFELLETAVSSLKEYRFVFIGTVDKNTKGKIREGRHPR